MVVPVVPARMEKTAVLALRHLARAPRGTARIYFTVRARRSLARCPQPLAAVLVADLAALHSLARPTRARLRLSDRPPLLLPTSAHRCLSHTRPALPADRPPLLLPTSHRCPALTGAFPILGRPPASVPTQPSAPKLRPAARGADGRSSRYPPPAANPNFRRATNVRTPQKSQRDISYSGPVSHYSPKLWIWN